MQCSGWFQPSCFCFLWVTRQPTKNVGSETYTALRVWFSIVPGFDVLDVRRCYKVTFNTIDNLIWKPQQTNTKGGEEVDDGKESLNHVLVFLFHSFSIYGNSFSLLLFRIHFSARFFIFAALFCPPSWICFPFARKENVYQRFRRSVYGPSKAVLISAYWGLRLNFIRLYFIRQTLKFHLSLW